MTNNAGWICLDYCKKISASTSATGNFGYTIGEYKTTANLHVRTGASTKYRMKTYKELTPNARSQNKRLGNYYYNGYKKGVVCSVIQIKGNWGRTKSGWICLDYCKKI